MVFYGILRLGKNSGILWNFITGTMERNNYAPNALNTREQRKEGREGEVGKKVGRDEERDGGRRGMKEGTERKGERKGGR